MLASLEWASVGRSLIGFLRCLYGEIGNFKAGIMMYSFNLVDTMLLHRDVVGESSVVGDTRWAGSWGIQADFTAKTACSIMAINVADIQVLFIARRVEVGE